MNVLIYYCGILADLVVADLNPDRTPPPSLSTRFRESQTQSQSVSYQAVLFVSVCHLYTKHAGLRKGSRVGGCSHQSKRCYSQKPSVNLNVCVYAKASEGKRTISAFRIDLFPPGYSFCSTKMYSLCECQREEMQPASVSQSTPLCVRFSRRSEADSFPTGEGGESARLCPRCH